MQPSGDERQAVLLGRWTSARLAEGESYARLAAELASACQPGPEAPTWDLRHLMALDHTGAQMLWNAWGRQWPASLRLLEDQRALIERVAKYTVVRQPVAIGTAVQEFAKNLWLQFLGLGEGLLLLLGHLRDMLRLVGQLALDLLRLLRAPREGPWRDVSGHLYRIGATAMPITAIVGF